MNQKEPLNNPRVIIIQKLYGNHLNKESKIDFPKHRYRKLIKEVVNGTIERKELIQDLIDKKLKNDINENKTELMVKLMIMAAIYEFMFMHKTPIKVIISEYLKVCDYFVQTAQKNFLNAILDKISKVSRISDMWNRFFSQILRKIVVAFCVFFCHFPFF